MELLKISTHKTIQRWSKDWIFSISKKGTLESPRIVEAELLLPFLLRFRRFCFSIASNQKLRKFLEKIQTIFGEINPLLHRFYQSLEL